MKDAIAKSCLKAWPEKLAKIWPVPHSGTFWIRARPTKSGNGPMLHAPGSKLFKTQPDGMWLYIVNDTYADAICIESCSSIQNLNDKRSRYMPSTHSLMVTCPLTWLSGNVTIQKGGTKPLWRCLAAFTQAPLRKVTLPLRCIRILYALKPDHYKQWSRNNIPAGHEYFCSQTSLHSYGSPKMQAFLRQMAISAHFYTKP